MAAINEGQDFNSFYELAAIKMIRMMEKKIKKATRTIRMMTKTTTRMMRRK